MVHANGEGNENRCVQMSYHLNKSTIHFMKENEDKIRDGVKAITSTSMNIFVYIAVNASSEWWKGSSGNGWKKEMTAVMAPCKALYKEKQLNCFLH